MAEGAAKSLDLRRVRNASGGTFRNWCTALAGDLKCCCFLSWDGQSEMSHVMSYHELTSRQVDTTTNATFILIQPKLYAHA